MRYFTSALAKIDAGTASAENQLQVIVGKVLGGIKPPILKGQVPFESPVKKS